MSDEFQWNMVRSDDPRFHDPRFQRRIVKAYRPIPIVENMLDVVLECGHSPLVLSSPDTPVPSIGQRIFCPMCEAEQKPS